MKNEFDLPVEIGSAWRWTMCVFVAICIGCNRNDDARKMEPRPTDTIKLTTDSVYYLSLPPRDRPPDGTFPAGTVVSVMVHQDNRWAGGFFRGQEGARGFFLVQTMDGFQAYVDIDGILDAEDVASTPDSDNAAEQPEGNKTSSVPKSGRMDFIGSDTPVIEITEPADWNPAIAVLVVVRCGNGPTSRATLLGRPNCTALSSPWKNRTRDLVCQKDPPMVFCYGCSQ